MPVLVGKYQVKRQVGGRGFYASASVELHEITSGTASITLEGDEWWRSSVAFGVDYALALTREQRRFRASVTLHTNVVDSTPAVVALAAARAVLDALGYQGGPVPDIEPTEHRVVFPQ